LQQKNTWALLKIDNQEKALVPAQWASCLPVRPFPSSRGTLNRLAATAWPWRRTGGARPADAPLDGWTGSECGLRVTVHQQYAWRERITGIPLRA
jgi:hypothetical protein